MKWKIERDTSKPNWTPKKLLDVSKLRELWWKYSISLDEWIGSVYEWFFNNKL